MGGPGIFLFPLVLLIPVVVPCCIVGCIHSRDARLKSLVFFFLLMWAFPTLPFVITLPLLCLFWSYLAENL
jgi:hypothetical protein